MDFVTALIGDVNREDEMNKEDLNRADQSASTLAEQDF
jgi:hypothetical protein